MQCSDATCAMLRIRVCLTQEGVEGSPPQATKMVVGGGGQFKE